MPIINQTSQLKQAIKEAGAVGNLHLARTIFENTTRYRLSRNTYSDFCVTYMAAAHACGNYDEVKRVYKSARKCSSELALFRTIISIAHQYGDFALCDEAYADGMDNPTCRINRGLHQSYMIAYASDRGHPQNKIFQTLLTALEHCDTQNHGMLCTNVMKIARENNWFELAKNTYQVFSSLATKDFREKTSLTKAIHDIFSSHNREQIQKWNQFIVEYRENERQIAGRKLTRNTLRLETQTTKESSTGSPREDASPSSTNSSCSYYAYLLGISSTTMLWTSPINSEPESPTLVTSLSLEQRTSR